MARACAPDGGGLATVGGASPSHSGSVCTAHAFPAEAGIQSQERCARSARMVFGALRAALCVGLDPGLRRDRVAGPRFQRQGAIV